MSEVATIDLDTDYVDTDEESLCDPDECLIDADLKEKDQIFETAVENSDSSLRLRSNPSAGNVVLNENQISRIIPTPDCDVWNRIPATCITERPELGELEMDPDNILPARKERFRNMVSIWFDSLVRWCNDFFLGSEDTDSDFAPVSHFVARFLATSNKQHVVDFICDTVIDQAQYILANPDFGPEDLLHLPRLSREDFNWGCYFDLFTDLSIQTVVGWYAGSATGFGYKKRPGGLIGRLLMYFPASGEPSFSHERWLAGTVVADTIPNFRKVADCGSRSQYHRVYTTIMEGFLMTIVGFNVDTKLNDTVKNLTEDTLYWVKQVRGEMGVKTFDRVVYINKCLPLKQGIPSDRRFNPNNRSKPGQCLNPIANCPTTYSTSWTLIDSDCYLGAANYICGLCARYRKKHGTHRPQHAIDEHLARVSKKKEAEIQGCYWCKVPFPSIDADRKNLVPQIEECLCKICYRMWKENTFLMPVKGLDYPQNFVFQCEGSDCRVESGSPRIDKSKALDWFFEKGDSGRLLCEECHCKPPNMTTDKIRAQRIKAIRKAGADGVLVPHEVQREDCKHRQLAGFRLYCKRMFNFEITGSTRAEVAISIKTIVESRQCAGDEPQQLLDTSASEDELGLSSVAIMPVGTSTGLGNAEWKGKGEAEGETE
ncbi:hypothetical protein H2204_006157 [Knufia peltigerae]|uniref:Uncharacterized protein n=1 Tax=Knufia peltigerae TaxID=1002370 RepID=A0AA38Y4J9_9EURO|nr:hypothetical protein H2204_006157 [Knufia peltigerae]